MSHDDYAVYVLVDPRDNSPKYVGFTSNAKERLGRHKSHLLGQNPEKEAWIRDLRLNHLEPIFQSLEVVTGLDLARNREIYWVRHYLKDGVVLLNILIAKTPYTLFAHIQQPEYSSRGSDGHCSYQLQYRRCNKAACSKCQGTVGHGPYWYAYWREGNRTCSRYIGRATMIP